MHRLPYWLAVEDGKLISYSDLAHLIASAIYPTEEEAFDYGAARVNLEKELAESVLNGALIVRNPAGLGRHTFPVGAGLAGSVLFAHELAPFLNERGIELRLTPYGSGPKFWTLDNAALAIAEQEGWHSMARETFLDQLLEAANTRALVVSHPHTDLPVNTGPIRTFYELTTPNDVNRWLSSIDAPYQWECDGGGELDEPAVVKTQTVPASRAPVVGGSAKEQWTAQARDLAAKYVDAWRAAGFEPTISDAALFVEGELFNQSIFNTRGGPIDRETIRRDALVGLTARRAGERRTRCKIPHGRREEMPS